MKSLPLLLLLMFGSALRAEIIVAEGEKFTPKDDKGWKITHQQDTYGSHTYGGMWMSQGASLGAPALSVGSVATQAITVSAAGKYRVWSKYQAPPYFNYLHKLEVVQGGKAVFTHVYGKKGTDRLWSFSGVSDELWWPWGVDHDCAEAPKTLVDLAAGPAELRLTTVENPKPAGDRFIDFVVLTTNVEDTYKNFKPYQVGSPFANEAIAATKLFVRFKNAGDKPAQLTISRSGHFQPQYGGATTKIPVAPVAAGQWSAWQNIGPFCQLVHDEGLVLSLGAGKEFSVQFARDEAGNEIVGDFTIADGEWAVVPIEITWKKDAVVKPAKMLAGEITAASKTWKKANGGKKPKEILFYGAFSGQEAWVTDLKDAIGYNTLLPDKYEHVARDGLFAHAGSADGIKAFAKTLKDKEKFRVLSFGDEIGLGKINYADPKNVAKFRDWLKARKVTKAELGGVEPAAATLADAGNSHLVWYSNLFNEEERFADFRSLTELAKKEIGPNVLTGANYSPHHLALYYGPIYQWVDIFKHQGMSMFWAEDYIFSVPEVPQIISWQFAQVRCAVKYHNQPIHYYIMPHAPGQEPGYLRRNTLLAVGNGSKHIDNFWVAPPERFTENYVSWSYPETHRTLHDAIFDTAEAEPFLKGGKVRPARVAVVTGKATDFNESRLMIDKAKDVFAKDCKNAPDKLNQIICRKDQQMLYLALKNAQHTVDTITEDDITELDILKNYDVVYFAGEWIDHRAIPKLEAWVNAGGVLYATAGCGHLNEFNEPEPAMLNLLGLKSITTEKNVAIIRTLLELPLLPVIDTLTVAGKPVGAIGMKQILVPDTAKAIGTWSTGQAGATVRELGKGKIFAVGTLAGNTWMKTGTKPIPYARGGRHCLYNPSGFDAATTTLVCLGVDARMPDRAVQCSADGIEASVMDSPNGVILTLTNWNDKPSKGVEVKVRIPFAPKSVRSVRGQKNIESKYAGGSLTFTIDLADADFVLIAK
ncbi:MAG: hypothetical protein EXS09_01190 [Gemmataceae bacterium]|nr:hypothetical protein [Gemmataceae bacterium]